MQCLCMAMCSILLAGEDGHACTLLMWSSHMHTCHKVMVESRACVIACVWLAFRRCRAEMSLM